MSPEKRANETFIALAEAQSTDAALAVVVEALRSAQSQARDEALETAAKEAEAYWVEFEHRRGSAEELVCYDLAERFRALKASKP
jgi:hypothetical protein